MSTSPKDSASERPTLGDEDWFYQQVLATVAIRPQRRWFGRRPAGFDRRTTLLLVAAALVGLLAGGALLAGPGIVKLPSVPPSIVPPTAPASTSPSAELPSATPTALPAHARAWSTYRNYVPRDSRHGCTPGNITWFGSGQPPMSAIGCGSRVPTEQARTSCFPDEWFHQAPVAW